jgi:hypothetical protein
LTVLAPQSVAGLGVEETWGALEQIQTDRNQEQLTIWVDYGENIEVVFVDKALDLR